MSQDVSIRIIVDGAAGEASVRRLSGEFTSLQNNVAGIERASGAATAGIARVNNAAAEMAAANARATMTTKEMAWALRGVPAQFTDIVTSLQGGQAPMTVFIQQGGQLKDMFGGAGNAARALGGYVASLITPMNVAAAGTVALAVAYYQGSEEAKAFAKSLAMTGNAAGVSINQLQNMAGAVAAATGATKGAAAAALAEIAGTGKVTAGAMEQAAAAAIALERTAGTAIADTVQQFAELGKSPVEASRKLNDQYNYLTVAVYQQIKALEDQGRTADAAAVAQAAYASAVQDNADKIKQRLGLLETGWKAVGDGAKIAWDKMVGVGRETPLEEQIAHQVKYLQDLRGGFFAVDTTKAENYLTQLQIQLEKTKKLAFEEGERARIQKEGVAAVDAVVKANDKSLSKQEQMNKALADYRDNIARVKAADPNSMLLDPAKIAKAEKGIREQFTEKPKKLADEYGPLIQAINEKAAAEDAALGTTEKLTAGEKFAIKVMTDVRDNTIRLTAAQKQSVAAGLEQYLVAEKKNVAEAELAKQAKASSELIGKMSGEERNRAESLAKSNESLRDEIAMLGLSQDDQADYRAAKLDSAAASDLATASAIDNLKAEWEANGAMPEIIAGYEALADAKRASAQALSEQSSLARQKAAKEVAVKAAEDSAKAWEKFGDQINQSLTDSLYRAFESGESFGEAFAKSLQNTFKTMALKLAIQTTMTTGGNLLNSGINALVGTSSNNGGAGTNYLGLASNSSSIYNLAGGTYLGYWQAAQAGASLTSTEAAAAAQAYYQAGYYGTGASIQAGAALGSASSAAGEAGSAVAGEMASSSTIPIIGWIIAAAVAMVNSGKLYKEGVTWQSFRDQREGTDAYNIDEAARIRSMADDAAALIVGRDYINSEAHQTISLGSLEAAMHEWVASGLFGKTRSTGTQTTGTFSEDDQGFDDGYWGVNMKKSGSLFSRSKEWTDWQQMPAEVDAVFDALYLTTRQSFVKIGESFGDSTLSAKLSGFSVAFKASTADVSIAMMQAGEQLFESMGKTLLPSIDGLRTTTEQSGKQITESWSQAFQRVLVESKAVNSMFEAMGRSLASVADADKVLAASDALIKLFGGIDALNTSFNAYYENFYSATEKTDRQWALMQRQFDGLGLTMPRTREGFRDLVDSLDLTTANGQGAFKALMDVQGAFAGLTPALNDAASAAALLGTAQSAVDVAYAALQRSVDAQKIQVQATIDAASEQISAIDGLFSVLELNIDDLRGVTVQSYASAMAELDQMLTTAHGTGYLPAADEVSKVVSAARAGMDQKVYASAFDAQKDRLILAGKLEDLQDVGEIQKSVAERQLRAAEEQLSTLDNMLDSARAQIDALRGVDNSVLTVSDAVQKMQAALVAELQALSSSILAALAAGQVSPQQAINNLKTAGASIAKDSWNTVKTTDGEKQVWVSSTGAAIMDNTVYANGGYIGAVDAAKSIVTDYFNGATPGQFVDAAKSVGLSAATIDEMYGFASGTANAWAEANNLPKFAVGTNYVQRDMIAQIHEGEAIIPKAFNPWAGAGQSRDGTTAVEIKLLKAEVVRLQGLIAESNAHARRTANAVNGNPEAPILVEVVA